MSSQSDSQAQQQKSYYAQDIDFDSLAKRDPKWATICKSGKETKWIDFQDPKILLQLTRSLLKCDFDLSSFDLPDDRLCPPVPVRWNYVRWIQDLLDTTSGTYDDSYHPEREVVGLDIGVGASAIYPLLACATRSKWRMFGTDIDQHSLDYAKKNVEANGLEDRVKLLLTTTAAPMIPDGRELDFVMMNPPFYASKEEMAASYLGKQAPPSAVCTGSENEMICAGGEIAFVSRLITRSLELRRSVRWYTAMLGKLPSLQVIVQRLREKGINNFAVTCLQAGHKTKRWAVGWSFWNARPRNDVARHGGLVLGVLPLPTAQTIAAPMMTAEWAGKKVDVTIKALEVQWRWDSKTSTGVMVAQANVWSRAARRKKKFGPSEGVSQLQDKDMEDSEGEEQEPDPALATKVQCKKEEVEVRWLHGEDHVLFESFCGMLKRAIASTGSDRPL